MKKVAEDERTTFHKEITHIKVQMEIDAKPNEPIKVYLEDNLARFKEQVQKQIRKLEKMVADAPYQLKNAQAKSDSTLAHFQNAKKIAESAKASFEIELTMLLEKAKLIVKAEEGQQAIKKGCRT